MTKYNPKDEDVQPHKPEAGDFHKHPDEIYWRRLSGDTLAWATAYRDHLISRHQYSLRTATGWAVGCLMMRCHFTDDPIEKAESDVADQKVVLQRQQEWDRLQEAQPT